MALSVRCWSTGVLALVVAVIGCAALVQGATDLECPEGWTQDGSNCYRFFNIRHSWSRAAELCRRYGSELVLVDTYLQNNFTGALAATSLKDIQPKSYWIGLTSVDDLATNTLESAGGTFVSVYMGFWALNEPRPQNGRCVQAVSENGLQEWSLTACETLLPFMCQMQACPNGTFFCSNGRCVNSRWRCDGQDDCGDMSDEVDCPKSCHFHLRSSGDSIQSTSYPNRYEPNSDCKWTLEGAVGTGIVLQFSDFDTETNFDTVQILAGGRTEESSVTLATLSGSQDLSTRAFTTASNLMIVKFRTDASVEKKGFRASWKSERRQCGGELFAKATAQVLTSPLHPQPYPGGLECLYVITAPRSKIITLEVTELDLEPDQDYILVRNGESPSDPLLARLTGLAEQNPRYIESTSNRVYLYFRTSLGDSRGGFAIRFRAGCEVEISADSGNISSPAYGVANYASNQLCHYRISRPRGGPLSMRFVDFNVASDDFVQVYDGEDSSGVRLHPGKGFTGPTIPFITMTAGSGHMYVAFDTNPMHTETGWLASFSADCPQLPVGGFAIASSRETTFGAVITYVCPLGKEFRTGGTRIVTECMQGGRWNVTHIPGCQERYCGPVPQIDNGFAVSAANVTFRGHVTYQCYAGFGFPSGRPTETVRCIESGQWERLPTCLASSCPPLPDTPHATRSILNGGDNRYGTVIRFQCESGYFRTGAPVIVCTSVGQWSYSAPTCERSRCAVIPVIEDGEVLDPGRQYFFGDEAKVQCHKGYKMEGNAVIKCGSNQTFDNQPTCLDMDECTSTSCDSASADCTNTPGSFFCKCKDGFEPNLDCRPVGDMGLRNGNIPDGSIKASSTESGFHKNGIRLDGAVGWCGSVPRIGENWIQIDLKAPTVLRGFRTQPVPRPDGSQAFPVSLRIHYTDDLSNAFRVYSDYNGRPYDFRMTHNGGPGLSVVNLPLPLEARYLRMVVMEYVLAPCMRMELMGCTRQSCRDINECLDKNGGCDQKCINSPGGFSCLCNVGYDLYSENGTSGFEIRPAETGLRDGDMYRLNKTCVPKMCPALSSPENGVVLSTKTMHHFGDIVTFHCNFGYVIVGSSTLLCTSTGEWNGTAPTCEYAHCTALASDPKQELRIHVAEDQQYIPFQDNITLSCDKPGRPLRLTATSRFRQCVYNPQPGHPDYWFSGAPPSCPRVDCGPPPTTTGALYGAYEDTQYDSSFYFGCEDTFTIAGKSRQNDNFVRCQESGTWDFGDLRCEGPVCEDPGHPPNGEQIAKSYEQGSQVAFSCDSRDGYQPYDTKPITCVKNAECKVIRPLGITSGRIPDKAINATSERINYEEKNVRLNSVTGWCAKMDSFNYVTVDLGKVYRIKAILVKGVVTNDIVGRPTDLRLFYRNREEENFVVYFPNFHLNSTGNDKYGELTTLTLDMSIRARYVILAIVAFQHHACLKFELMGCEDTGDEVLLGYDRGYPMCVDKQPPQFINCPSRPIIVAKSPTGLQPANFTEPIAIDNSGYIARFEVRPAGFKPPVMLFKDMSVQYFAYDSDGNVAVCTVNITIPDDTPPSLSCPQSYVIELVENQDTYQVNFEEVRRMINASDKSGDVTVAISPQTAFIPRGGFRNVTVMATDKFGNQAMCHFQVSVQAAPCVSWSLAPPVNGAVNCQSDKVNDGFVCVATCNEGYKFTDAVESKLYQCSSGLAWSPSSIIPDCVSEDTDKATYDVMAEVQYRAGGALTVPCLKQYFLYIRNYSTPLNQALSDRCSAINVKIDISFHNTTVEAIAENMLLVGYTLRIQPAVRQLPLYDLCGSTLGLIFELGVPSTSAVIEPILNITSRDIGGLCPGILAIRSSVTRGFTCGKGEVLNSLKDGDTPTCLHCPAGTFASDKEGCMFCPRGFYQDLTRQGSCRQCPEGTYTRHEGSKSVTDCVSVCGYGTYSPTGLVPCLQCPSNTFTGSPPKDGFRECQRCPANTYTYSPGSTQHSDCRVHCPPGMYSETGLEPCAACPINFYQPLEGQLSCIECSANQRTLQIGAINAQSCVAANCSSHVCQHGGLCQVQNHKPSCYCPAGFSGRFCEIDLDECGSQPCYNGGTCIDRPQGYACNCPPGFSGLQCQEEMPDCQSNTCPKRAMCQDLPGIGNFKCLCRSGYEGEKCDEAVNPCTSESSTCSNGATCIPLLQGRYQCLCPPGWTGHSCENNVDDCAENPCLLGANCTDLVNDFWCDCPTGFIGKRCEQKVDMCENNPCFQGICVDKLFSHECICNPGWTGQNCDVNIDECLSNPCANEGQCIDLIYGYRCDCDAGYTGSQCQHLIDDCESSPCQNGGTCVDQADGFACQCRPGFVGLQCEAEVDECVSSPCNPSGTERCIDMDNAFKCQCNPGFTGEYCEFNINECASDPCLNEGTCSDGINGFTCQCEAGWTGQRCELDMGTCNVGTCLNDASCINIFQDYFCVCPSGTDGKRCQTSPQRCIGNPCMNQGICHDYGSGQNCSCPLEYSGIGCQYEYNPCDDNTCMNGATCLSNAGSFKCICPSGFTGNYCEQDIPDCTAATCPTIAMCIDLTMGFYCKCPFNLTGEDCRKAVDIDYDLYINDESRSSSVALAAPFLLDTTSLSIALWVQYNNLESKGTFFTLYSVDSPHIPLGKNILVQADDTGVYVSLFPNITREGLLLRYLDNVPINDGQWHHIVLMWDGVEGTLTMVMDTAVAGLVTGYATGTTLSKYGWVSLGAPLNEENKASPNKGFHGRLSRVNIWDRTLDVISEIPVQFRNCRGAPVLYAGLLLRWTGYDRVDGNVERMSPGKCGERICPVGYTGDNCHILHQDKIPPQVLHCPPDKWVIATTKTAKITWEEPRFTDDLRSLRITEKNNFISGQTLMRGTHELSYVARDEAGNTAQCGFRIHLMSEFCPIPEPPVAGKISCFDWGPGGYFKVCSISCNDGMEFSQKVARFYTCGTEGFWRPSSDPSQPFIFPACSTKEPAQRIFKLNIEFPSSVICSDSGKKILHDRIKESLQKVHKEWNICFEENLETPCSGLQVIVRCHKQGRVARQVENSDAYIVELSFPANIDPVINSNTQEKSTVQEVVETAILQNSAFDVRNILPNVSPDLASLELVTDYSCSLGKVAVGPNCVECAVGTFYSNFTKTCLMCPVGTYQDEMGHIFCKPCPLIGGRQGITASLGARSSNDCKELCSAGTYYDDATGHCQPCGYGLYQPLEGSFSCIPCGPGKATRSNQAVSSQECRDECILGYELNAKGECEACQRGSFRARGMPACQQCLPGKTTRGRAATDEVECTLDICYPGQYVDAATEQCVPCPKGTYQDKHDRVMQCQKCNHTTRTNEPGATSASQCTDPCVSNGEMKKCPPYSMCVYYKEIDALDCKCQVEYKLNNRTNECLHVCEGYCENGGTCDVHLESNKPKCSCPANFFGERCSEKSEFVYVAGGIAGAVIIIIILVLLVWMICARSTKKKHQKMPEPHMDIATSQTNFFYGTHPVPYAESIAPSHHSTYAHYFDDDDDEGWEMPNFYNETYMQDGLHPIKGNTLGHSNPSLYGNKEEIYDRLRRHQYQGKKGDSTSDSEEQPH